jgi:hypothetical protein
MVLDGIFENNLLRFDLFHLRLLRNQRTQADNSEVLRKPSLDFIKAKVIRVELRLCVGEEVRPRKGIRARWR